MPIAQRLLSTRDAATYLGCSPKTIRRITVQYRLPIVRLNSLVRFDRADLDRYAERQKQVIQ